MSWNTAKKRFVRDVERLPTRIRDAFHRSQLDFALPSFDKQLPPTQVNKSQQKSSVETGITEGDIVYITQGDHKGEIATVNKYIPIYDAYVLSNSTSKRIFHKSNWVEGQSSHLIDFPNFIPRENIKLAGKEKDPESGKSTFLVADEIELKDKYYDDRYKMWIPRRFIKHHDTIEIPWPNPPAVQDGTLSTAEDTVFEKSYELQTIAKPPMPIEALAQLRNPHSKHKKRIFTKMQVGRIAVPDMPLSVEQKIYLARKSKAEEAGEVKKVKKLSPEVIDFVGQRIAEHINKIDNPAMLEHLEGLAKNNSQN